MMEIFDKTWWEWVFSGVGLSVSSWFSFFFIWFFKLRPKSAEHRLETGKPKEKGM